MRSRLAGTLGRYRGFEPDARRFLIVTLVAGGATSLWWIDFNLYLVSLGVSPSGIGVIATINSTAAALAVIPASALSDRVGRRLGMAAAFGVAILAVLGLAATSALVAIAILAPLFSAANATVQVLASPFMTEHSRAEHRSELFALQFAIGSATNVIAAVVGGILAAALAGMLGVDQNAPETFRLILVFMAALLVPALAVVLRLGDDRPARRWREAVLAAGEPARFVRTRVAGPANRLGMTIRDRGVFAKLLLPNFLISLGAGQVIPFLNVFVHDKFGLDIVALNGAFAVTSLGTMLAILAQPSLARRFGRIRSVIIVQGASIPFLVVLGFSPILWLVIAAMAVRNSLMNAGNPLFNAFAMDQVSPTERATLAALLSMGWSVGWVIAGAYYAVVHALFSLDAGYAINFVTVIVLYSLATLLYWRWFAAHEVAPVRAASPTRATD